jgi:hypothetical protein
MNIIIQELLWNLGFTNDYPQRDVTWVVRVWRGGRSVIAGRFDNRGEAIDRAKNVLDLHRIDLEDKIKW